MNKELSHLLFRVRRKARRFATRYSFEPCPTSYPYLSGDTFRSYADMMYDTISNSVAPEKVSTETIIFVCTDKAEEFFKDVHPKIKNPYTLITHNSDLIIDQKMAGYADEKILKWYAMSDAVPHERIVPIPAGLENLRLHNFGIVSLFERYRKLKPERKARILFGFTIASNARERQPAYDALVANPSADSISGIPDTPDYMKLVTRYKFVAAPPGNAIESHRMWESMYLGAVPIVKRSFMMDHFASLGLPIWLVDDWHELDGLSENELSDRYADIMGHANDEPLYMDYWIDRIAKRK